MTPATPANTETLGKYIPARPQSQKQPAGVAGVALKSLARRGFNACREIKPVTPARPYYRKGRAGVGVQVLVQAQSTRDWRKVERRGRSAIVHGLLSWDMPR
jgi:hypothetical protein